MPIILLPMNLLYRLLKDRTRDGIRRNALAIGSTVFTVLNYLVFQAVAPQGFLQILLALIVSALSLTLIVSSFQRLLLVIWANPILGRWIYESSSSNWGIADLAFKGSELTYSVQLYKSKEDTVSALREEAGFASKCFATVSSSAVSYENGTVELIYRISQTDVSYNTRGGMLTLRPLASGAMKGYWKSDIQGTEPTRGVLDMYRPEGS